jgi:hypothetical protein
MFGIFSKSKKTSSKKKKPGKKKSKKGDAEANTEASSQPKSFAEDAAAPSDSPSSIVSAQEKLDAAKANLEAGNFKQKLAPDDREALIQQAMAVHKQPASHIGTRLPKLKPRKRAFDSILDEIVRSR